MGSDGLPVWVQQHSTRSPQLPTPAINPSHHRGTKEVGSCNRNNKDMSHSRPGGMRLCLCLCPVLIRKGRETASPSLAAGAAPCTSAQVAPFRCVIII